MTQQVLVHIDADLGPIGAWSYRDGHLIHFYPESLDLSISGRARIVMAARDTPIPEWFHLIAATEPTLLDQYCVVETSDELTPATVLAKFRRDWNATDNTS